MSARPAQKLPSVPQRPRVERGRHRRHGARIALVARQGNGRAAGGGRARGAVAIVDVVARIHDRHPGKRLRAVESRSCRPGCERPCWHPRPQRRCPHWRDRPAGRPGPARRSRSLQPIPERPRPAKERASRRRSRRPPARAAATMQAASSRCPSARRPRCAARPPIRRASSGRRNDEVAAARPRSAVEVAHRSLPTFPPLWELMVEPQRNRIAFLL